MDGVAVDVCHVSGGRNDVLGVVVRVISLEVCGVGVEFAVVVYAESASKPSPCVKAVARFYSLVLQRGGILRHTT